jgi:hypothetical protein
MNNGSTRNDGGNLKPGFVFPKIRGGNILPAFSHQVSQPVTASSRPIMIHTIQAGTQPSDVIMIKAEDTSSLSATGSMTFPKLDSKPRRLAKKPSRASVPKQR